jgi:hypothetical protein
MSKEYHGNLNNPANGEQHVREQLWPYIDGNLPAAERDAVRAHLESCADCRADYVELRGTQQMLSSMPVVPAPRAFTLTPEMVGRKPSLLDRLFAPRYAPRFATGSVLTFVLLLFIFASNAGVLNSLSATPAFNKIGSGLKGGESNERNAGAEQDQAAPMTASAEATATTGSVADPTATPASAGGMGGAIPEGTTAASSEEPNTTAMQPSQATTAPGEQSTTQDTQGLTATTQAEAPTPDTGVITSANISPSTTDVPGTMFMVTPADSSPPNVPQASDSGQRVVSSQAGMAAVQIGLLALGLALGVAAVIAYRHGSG